MAKFASAFTVVLLLVVFASVAQVQCKVKAYDGPRNDMPGEPPYR